MSYITVKAVLNNSYGGYSLSKEAYKFLNIEWDEIGLTFNDNRNSLKLINCISELGKKANGKHSNLTIVEKKIKIINRDGHEFLPD